MVPPCSDRISRVPPYSRTMPSHYPYGAVTRYGPPFQTVPVRPDHGHWPGPRSLATTCGVSVDVLSSGYLDVSVPRVRLAQPMDSVDDTAEAVGCPIRKSTDQRVLAPPHGLSQRATSFIASRCQGIHQMPFMTLDLNPTQCATRRSRAQTGTQPDQPATASGKDASHDPTDRCFRCRT